MDHIARFGFAGLLALAVVSAVGCGKKKDDKAAGAGEAKSQLVGTLEGLADRACACRDEACSAGVRTELETLARSTGKVDDKDMAPLQKAQARLDDCLASLDPVVASYRVLVDKVCACAAKECAEKVSAEFHQWAQDLKASGKTMPQRDARIAMQAGLKAKACLDRYGLPAPQ